MLNNTRINDINHPDVSSRPVHPSVTKEANLSTLKVGEHSILTPSLISPKYFRVLSKQFIYKRYS